MLFNLAYRKPAPIPPTPDYLCFTANTAGSKIRIYKSGSPTEVSLETSTDKENWSTYTFGEFITLSNVGDKLYWRNTSETDTGFSTSTGDFYKFGMSGDISASGDVTTLLNKSGTLTVGNYCFYTLFNGCQALKTPPKLPATTVGTYSYAHMFNGCSLNILPKLPATTLPSFCYSYMFYHCGGIKLSSSKTGDYQTEYRIPYYGDGTGDTTFALYYMFNNTGGSWQGTPTMNTTYYTSNTVV